MRSESPLKRRPILLVDDDSALLGLIASLLNEAGSEVTTIEGVEGFTPELMALGKPSLVLLNPNLAGLTPALMKSVVETFKSTARRPIILIADMGPDALAAAAVELGADGYIPVRELLENPLSHVLSHAAEAVPEPVSGSGDHSLNAMAPAEILELELAPLNSVAPPPARPSSPPARTAVPGMGQTPPGVKILAAIEEELSKFAEAPVQQEEFEVALDVFGEHNLYADPQGSAIGVFIASSMMIPAVGTSIRVCVRFPWRGEFTCPCVVDWTRDASWMNRRSRGGFAARFTQLGAFEEQQIQRFVGQRAPMKSPAR